MSTGRRSSLKGALSAQEMISEPVTIKYGFLRKKERSALARIWSQRYIILTSQKIFVFDSETSKSTRESVNLVNLIGVVRYTAKSRQAPWAFTLQPAGEDKDCWRLSCACDSERVRWMLAIKNAIAAGRDFEVFLPREPELSLCSESVYKQIEECIDENDSSQKKSRHKRSSNSTFYIREATNSRSSDSSASSGFVDPRLSSGSVFSSKSEISTKSFTAQPIDDSVSSETLSDGHSDGSDSSDGPLSPLGDDPPPPHRQPEHDYANITVGSKEQDGYMIPEEIAIKTLEEMSIVSDVSRNMMHYARMKAKGPGAYIIRKSKTSNDCRVLSCCNHDQQIIHFKLYRMPDGRMTLDNVASFANIEELLTSYTYDINLPVSEASFIGKSLSLTSPCGDFSPNNVSPSGP